MTKFASLVVFFTQMLHVRFIPKASPKKKKNYNLYRFHNKYILSFLIYFNIGTEYIHLNQIYILVLQKQPFVKAVMILSGIKYLFIEL